MSAPASADDGAAGGAARSSAPSEPQTKREDGDASDSASSDDEEATFSRLKAFLADAQGLGEFRLIATNSAAVMESIAPLDKLFYASVPARGEYANVIDAKINLDLHLRLGGVQRVRFEQGVSRRADKSPTYVMRFVGENSAGEREVVLSAFLSPVGECSDERVARWTQMRDGWCTVQTGSDGAREYVCSFVDE